MQLKYEDIKIGCQGLADITDEQYYSSVLKMFKSQSDIKNIFKSPSTYYHSLETHIDNPAMRGGRMAHKYLLQPDSFYDSYVVGPSCRRGTKEWKSFEEENVGKEIIKPDEYKDLVLMAESLYNHNLSRELLEDPHSVEQAFFFNADTTGEVKVPAKGKYDLLTRDGILVDLKTMSDASPHNFAWQCKKFLMHLQPAFYMDGLEVCGVDVNGFRFVCVEKTPPFNVAVYELDHEWIYQARTLYMETLEKFTHMKEIDRHNGYAHSSIKVPYRKY